MYKDLRDKVFGTDVIKMYNFKFGMWRYHVEQFDHDHTENKNDNLDNYLFVKMFGVYSKELRYGSSMIVNMILWYL